MKIALVHDYIKEYGGAERVLEALHEIYPKAPVYTSVYLPKYLGPHKKRFETWKIRTSWLQNIPFKQKLISPFRILAPFIFCGFDFSEYDVVIVSATGAYAPNLINKKSAVQVCYCHTPPRYLYGYATARDWKKNKLMNIVGEFANHILRMVDFNAAQKVDYFIANSEEVKTRIKKFYRKDATVIYPPVDISTQQIVQSKQKSPYGVLGTEYYLAGGRLARPKHIDHIIDACLELNIPLKVFGKSFAGYGDELESRITNKESNVEFLGEVADKEKLELMSHAKAYINASEDEDFGILPVEAMATGTPVIAYRSGGVKETVVDGKTGVFFEELTVESLKNAIKKFEKTKFDPKDIERHAEKFSKERFMKQIKIFVQKYARIT